MLDDWTWLNLVGGMAQIVGLLVAMRGVHKLKADAFPDEPSSAATLTKRVGAFVWYRVLRRKRKPVHLRAEGVASLTISSSATATVTPARPPCDASVDDVLDYVDRVRELLIQDRQQALAQVHERADKLRYRVERNEQSTDERFAQQDERITLGLGGRSGRGLDTTWLGLVIAAAGLVAQGVAILLAARIEAPPTQVRQSAS